MTLSSDLFFVYRGWSLETGRCEKIYRGHSDTVTCLEICEDKMASGARDNHCKGNALDLCLNEYLEQCVEKIQVRITHAMDD